MASQSNSRKSNGALRRYTFVLNSEFALECDIIAHLQRLGPYRTTEALRRWALRGFQWRLASLANNKAGSSPSPAWAGEAPHSDIPIKKRCWMYLSARIESEDDLSSSLDRMGPDRRAQITRDLVIDGFWLEKVGTQEIRQVDSTPESIVQKMPQTPSSDRAKVDNVVQPTDPQQDLQPQPASASCDVIVPSLDFDCSDLMPEPVSKAPDSRPVLIEKDASQEVGSVNDPVLVQGQPMQQRDRSSPSQASALAALVGGAHFGKKSSDGSES